MSSGHDAVISLAWLVAVIAAGIGLVAGAVQVATDFTATNVYRWIMASLFLGCVLGWLTVYYRSTLRRFFHRSRTP